MVKKALVEFTKFEMRVQFNLFGHIEYYVIIDEFIAQFFIIIVFAQLRKRKQKDTFRLKLREC